jgi:hypothetical protein
VAARKVGNKEDERRRGGGGERRGRESGRDQPLPFVLFFGEIP